MKGGYFEFWNLDSEGGQIGTPVHLRTDEGVIMNSHHKCKQSEIRHLCSIARSAPGQPVELTHWTAGLIEWSARIYWRNGGES